MIKVGRRPVLILWATIVAERLGFERDEALTLGRALASFGGSMIKAPPDAVTPAKIAEMRAKLLPGQTVNVSFIDRAVSIARVPEGLRAVLKNRPIDPASVELYLGEKFGDQIDNVAGAMISLAETLPRSLLAKRAFELYEQFRPETIELDIKRIAASVRSNPRHDASDDDRRSESWWEDSQGEMPSFRGPQAVIGVVRSHVVEPIHRERTADLAPSDHEPAGGADALTRKTRGRAIEPAASPRSMVVAASPVTQPMLRGAIPAHRSTSPLVLILAVTLAGTIGGGVGGLLVALPQHARVVTELRGLFPLQLHTSSSAPQMSEAEPTRADAYAAPAAGASRRGLAIETSTPPAPATAIVPPATTLNGVPEYPPVDNQVSELTRTERSDEAPGSEPMAVEMSPPLAPTTAAVPPSSTVNGVPESPVDSQISELTRTERSDEAPGIEPLAVEMSPPLAPTTAAVLSSSTVDGAPESLPVDNQGTSEVARIERELPLAPATAVVPPSNTVNETLHYPRIDSNGAADLARIAMERGDERMRQGDVTAARRFYEMAVGAGMVQAATAIGRTFDPLYLGHIRVRGALADAEKAKQWYENAAKAGDMEALARIELMTWNSSNR